MNPDKKLKIYSALITLLFLSAPLLGFGATAEETAELQKQLDVIQQEIDQYEDQLSSVKSEKDSLTKKINQLKWQQSKITLQIRQSNLTIVEIEDELVNLEEEIQQREESIAELNLDIGALLRLIEKKDHFSWLEIWITQKDIGGYFAEVAEYKKITTGLAAAVQQMEQDKILMEETQQALSEKREEQSNLIAIATLQNQQLQQTLAERNELLAETKNKEENYQAMISDREQIAAEIKGRIYDLLGISKEVTFGEAVTIAQWASSQTGVRTAFLLAILTQESNLGKNVGTCNRLGDPPEKSWEVIMKPSRDQEPFLTITEELGMDPDITPVSCPMYRNGEQIGWGGAMGPAQFIPSTWMGYKDKVSAITGKAANPWDIRDAFLAAALLLKDNGAGSQSGEWAAAMRYFSGSTNPAYRFYGDNVVALAEEYQQDINDLQAQ